MAVAIGVDITSIQRIAGVLQRRPRFAEKIFTATERRRCGAKIERFASRWAAKEAVKKLCGSRGVPIPTYRSIEVVNRRGGAPMIRIGGMDTDIALTLTHDAGLAIAVAATADDGLWGAPALPPPPGLRLPERPADGHKGTFGTVTLIAGSPGTAGAAVLAALGAARGGAGKVRLCVPDAIYATVAPMCLEVMAQALPADENGTTGLGRRAVAGLLEMQLGDASAVVVGPGLGRDPGTEMALADLLPAITTAPLVVDADGLNIAAAQGFDWHRCNRPVVITPHPAEMARLVGTDIGAVQGDRDGVASRYATQCGVVVVLKGAGTVVAAPDGRSHVDGHRTVALATGGTGDVLAGLCGAMLAGGLDVFDAAVAAVTIHAEAGCIVESQRGRAGGLAGDVVDALPVAQERLRRTLERLRPGRGSVG